MVFIVMSVLEYMGSSPGKKLKPDETVGINQKNNQAIFISEL